MTDAKPRLVGLNHLAIEVADVDAALEFYGKVFDFEMRGSHRGNDGVLDMAFIDMGDQFLAISRGREQEPDTGRHFGLVVDDRTVVMDLALAAGASIPEGRPFNFLDPWGNHVEIVEYRDVQFSKTSAVLKAMGVDAQKSQAALDELRQKGMI